MSDEEATKEFDAEGAARLCQALSEAYGEEVIDALSQPEPPEEFHPASDDDLTRATLAALESIVAFDGVANQLDKIESAFWLRCGLACARVLKLKEAEARFLIGLGAHKHIEEDFERAMEFYERADEILTQAGNRLGMAMVAHYRALAHTQMAEDGYAIEHFERAADFWEEVGDHNGLARTLNGLGNTQLALGRPEDALRTSERVLAIASRTKLEDVWKASALTDIGISYQRLEEHQKAQDSLVRAIALWKKLNDPISNTVAEETLAVSLHQDGRSFEALKHLKRSLHIQSRAKLASRAPDTLRFIGQIYLAAKRHGKALRAFKQSRNAARKAEDQKSYALALNHIGLTHYVRGRTKRALPFIVEALPIAEKIADTSFLRIALSNASRAYYAATNEPEPALTYAERALVISRKHGNLPEIASDTVDIAIILGENPQIGRQEEAFPMLRDAIALMTEHEIANDSSGTSLYDLKLMLVAWSDKEDETSQQIRRDVGSLVDDSQPLIERLTRRARFPSARLTLWLAFGLGLAALALAAVAVLGWEWQRLLGSILLTARPVIWGLHLLAPLATTGVAFFLARREAQSQTYDLQVLTNLSQGAMFRGYVYAALHRVRLLLGALVATMPLLVVGVLLEQLLVVLAISGYASGRMAFPYSLSRSVPAFLFNVPFMLGGFPACPWPLAADVFDAGRITTCGLSVLAATVGLWGLNGVGAVFGVDMGLKKERRAESAWLPLLAVAMYVSWFSSSLYRMQNPEVFIGVRVLIALAMAFGSYFLAWVFLRMGTRDGPA